MNNKTFIKITNAQIYGEIKGLREDFGSMKGRIKINTWIASTSLAICLVIIGCILQ